MRLGTSTPYHNSIPRFDGAVVDMAGQRRAFRCSPDVLPEDLVAATDIKDANAFTWITKGECTFPNSSRVIRPIFRDFSEFVGAVIYLKSISIEVPDPFPATVSQLNSEEMVPIAASGRD
jgi:hypothetical protein